MSLFIIGLIVGLCLGFIALLIILRRCKKQFNEKIKHLTTNLENLDEDKVEDDLKGLFKKISELQSTLKAKTTELEMSNTVLQTTQASLVEKERLAAVGELTVAINHEINNPLATILGNAQLLQLLLSNADPKITRKLELIVSECRRIANVTHRLRNLDTIEVTEYVNNERMIDIDRSSTNAKEHDVYMTALNDVVDEIDKRKLYSKGHSNSVVEISLLIGRDMHLPDSELFVLEKASKFCDLGMLGIDHEILTKKGTLTEKEWNEIKKHTIIGEEVLRKLDFDKKTLMVLRQHHEHFDGSGYPDNLKGEEISLLARIIRVSESYIAFKSKRPYRAPLSNEEIINQFESGKRKIFDPIVVESLYKVMQNEKD